MSRPDAVAITFDDEPDTYVPTNPRHVILTWWETLDPIEKVLYRGLAALAVGLAAVAWPLALIVPGTVLTGLAVTSYAATLRRVNDG